MSFVRQNVVALFFSLVPTTVAFACTGAICFNSYNFACAIYGTTPLDTLCVETDREVGLYDCSDVCQACQPGGDLESRDGLRTKSGTKTPSCSASCYNYSEETGCFDLGDYVYEGSYTKCNDDYYPGGCHS